MIKKLLGASAESAYKSLPAGRQAAGVAFYAEIIMKENKRILGLLILGGFNFIVLGILSLGFFLFIYKNPSSETGQILLAEFSKHIPGKDLTLEQFRAAVLSQIILAAIFLVSGWGLLNRKEWGRRLTLYFSFFMVILAAVTVLFRFSLINSAISQIIYPGILIIYLTNKNVEKVFNISRSQGETEENK